MQLHNRSRLLIISLVLLLYVYTPTLAETLDLSNAESDTGVHYTGMKIERERVRGDRNFNEQETNTRPRSTIEPDTDRPGSDYKNFWLAGEVEECREACVNDPHCKAYTYLKPGIKGEQARCFLKSRVPEPVRNPCCISGKKGTPVAREEVRRTPYVEGRTLKTEDFRKEQEYHRSKTAETRPAIERRVVDRDGWCCLNGEIFPASSEDCKGARGRFFATRQQAEEYAIRRSSERTGSQRKESHPRHLEERHSERTHTDISGEWFSNRGRRYVIEQRESYLEIVNLDERQVSMGHVETDRFIASPKRGGSDIVGHILEVDGEGRAHMLELSNGIIWARAPFPQDRTENRANRDKAEELSRVQLQKTPRNTHEREFEIHHQPGMNVKMITSPDKGMREISGVYFAAIPLTGTGIRKVRGGPMDRLFIQIFPPLSTGKREIGIWPAITVWPPAGTGNREIKDFNFKANPP